MNRADLRAALAHPNVAAFYMVVRSGESSLDDDAYRMRYNGPGNRPAFFESFADHPRVFVDTGKGTRSSAAGAPQATATTFDEERAKYGWPDFTPQTQDEFFVARLVYRKALEAVKAGRFAEACQLCRKEWTSLPGGAEENAATRHARETFLRWGGTLAGESGTKPAAGETKAPESGTRPTFQDILDEVDRATDPDAWQRAERYGETVTESTTRPIPSADEQEANMAPLILPLLQVAAQFLPQLAEKFGSGSEVANRNIAAGKVLAEAITSATNSPNLQAAVEKMASDPGAVKAAKEAVAQTWPDLFEVGGGIAAARKASEVYASSEWWRMLVVPQTWIAFLLLGLVYIAMGNVTGLFGFQGWTPELRSNVVFAIVGVAIGSVSGYYFGTSQGSQRKTDLLAHKE